MESNLLAHSLIILLLTASLYLVLRPFAFRVGLVDQPDARKHHEGQVPLVGGVGMLLSFLVALQLLDGAHSYTGILIGALLVGGIGACDDYMDLSSTLRFAAQIAASGAMIYWDGAVLHNLGVILPGETLFPLGPMAIPLTIFATVGVINALNMIDGVDGLAGSVAMTSLLAVALLAFLNGNQAHAKLALLLASATFAFLLFNWRHTGDRRALIFMGDAGSMFLGFVICWLFVKLSQGDGRAFAPVAALWIFALPLIDTVTMMLRRILKGQSPFQADREHFHHMLLAAGFDQRQTVFIMLGISVLCSAFGVIAQLTGIREDLQFGLFLLLFGLHFLMVRHAWRVKRFLKRRLLVAPHAEQG